jgi:hypothetical protein
MQISNQTHEGHVNKIVIHQYCQQDASSVPLSRRGSLDTEELWNKKVSSNKRVQCQIDTEMFHLLNGEESSIRLNNMDIICPYVPDNRPYLLP